ncbi:MAG: ABC transporter ATP-binding protein [Pirellulaceae bacterium]|nr:ABC transporter ATP-binding protein [Planctomycetales bacterium]MCA9202476.1 ABC transporter ATP-binding protein [Planctomycetales bacterium]
MSESTESANRPVAVQCRQVTKVFGQGHTEVRALRGIDLTVYTGELTLLMGPSGCGKTTLLSVIAGILEATDGEIQVLGNELQRMSAAKKTLFRQRQLGFVFQQYNLLMALNAAENVAVPLIIAGVARSAAIKQGQRLLEKVGLSKRSRAMPYEMSGGEQQRVAIARALVHQPRLIVCDEPTASLDADSGHAIMELLRDSAIDTDRSVIVVTHDPRVMEFGDRIARMEDGQVVQVESSESASSQE